MLIDTTRPRPSPISEPKTTDCHRNQGTNCKCVCGGGAFREGWAERPCRLCEKLRRRGGLRLGPRASGLSGNPNPGFVAAPRPAKVDPWPVSMAE